MWAVFAAALLATLRRRLRLRPLVWRRCHTTLAAVTVLGSVVHALLIEGTMGLVSKAALCAGVGGGREGDGRSATVEHDGTPEGLSAAAGSRA